MARNLFNCFLFFSLWSLNSWLYFIIVALFSSQLDCRGKYWQSTVYTDLVSQNQLNRPMIDRDRVWPTRREFFWLFSQGFPGNDSFFICFPYTACGCVKFSIRSSEWLCPKGSSYSRLVLSFFAPTTCSSPSHRNYNSPSCLSAQTTGAAWKTIRSCWIFPLKEEAKFVYYWYNSFCCLCQPGDILLI